MPDIKSPSLLYLKGGLMLLTGGLAAGLLIAQSPSWKTCLFLGIAIWGFCRAYYFAFYVIEHYVDPDYKFTGLTDFFSYCLDRKPRPKIQRLHPERSVEPEDRTV